MTNVRHLTLFLLAAAVPAQSQGQPDRAPSTAGPQDEAASSQQVRAQLGIEFSLAGSKLRRMLVRTRMPHGFAIRSVTAGSLADKAGLDKGTIVLCVDGHPLREVAELAALLTPASAEPADAPRDEPNDDRDPEGATPPKIVLACARRKAKASLLDRNPWEHFEVELELPSTSQPTAPEPATPSKIR